MKYSTNSLYEVMKDSLSNLLMKSFLDKRGKIVFELAFGKEPLNDKGEIVTEFGEFMLDMATALKILDVDKPEVVDQIVLAQSMSLMFSYDHMRDRDLHFISTVQEFIEKNS